MVACGGVRGRQATEREDAPQAAEVDTPEALGEREVCKDLLVGLCC